MNASAEYLQLQHGSAEDLVRTHAPLVKRIAYHLKGRLPANVEVSDLIQAGMIGLLDAARHYVPSRTANFETYASIRIRGAMLDELRKTDWTPRSVYRKLREVTEVVRQLEKETGRSPEEAEIVRRLGISAAEYNQILSDATSCRVLSLTSDEEDNEATDVPDENGLSPASALEESSFHDALTEAVAALPERERMVMSLYYDEELNLKEIGLVLGVTESRVCQIHGQALLRLRSRLQDWQGSGP